MRPSYAACLHFLRKDFRVESLFGKGAEGNGVDDGFSGDGFGVLGCSDLDECQSNPCLATEYCVNTMGSPWILNFMPYGNTFRHSFICILGKNTCINESVIVSYAFALLVMLK